MRTIRSAICLVTFSIGVAAPAVYAQQPAGTLTLEDAIAQGLANSERLAELVARQDSAAAIADGRAAARLPIVAAQGGYNRTNHVEEFAIIQPGAAAAGCVSRRPRQLPRSIGRPVAGLHRRPRGRARARGKGRASGDGGGSSRRRAPTCAWRSRARSGRSSPRAKPSRC